MLNMNTTKVLFAIFSMMPACALSGASITAQASTIIVGEVTSGQQNGNSAVFAISVVRTLKGNADLSSSRFVPDTVRV